MIYILTSKLQIKMNLKFSNINVKGLNVLCQLVIIITHKMVLVFNNSKKEMKINQ